MFFSIVKLIIFLIIIIYLINISLKYLAKYTNQASQKLRIIQKLNVTKTSALGIVQIGEKYYVMSLAEQQNQIIRELTASEANDFMLSPTPKTPATPQQFKHILEVTTKKLSKGKKE